MPKLSKADVVEQLTAKGIAHDPNAKYNDLYQLLKADGETTVEQPSPEVVAEPAKVEAPVEEKKTINPFSSFQAKTPMGKKSHEMRKKLMHQPRVPVFIPLGHEEQLGATLQITLNGYSMFIRKGMQVDVPVQVAEVINAKLKHQDNVRMHPFRVSGQVPDNLIKPFN